MAKLYTKTVWQDETLAGDERYDIKDNGGADVHANVQIALRTAVVQAGTAADAARMNNLENGLDAVDTRADVHGATAKATPVDADELPVLDSAASFAHKKFTWANLKATLKSYLDTLYPPADGWMPAGETWTYASPTTFAVPGDQTAKYKAGLKWKCTNSTLKQGYVLSSSYSAPNTTVTVVGDALENAAISANYYSRASNPQGFPDIFSYTPGPVGLTSPVIASRGGFFTIRGKMVQCWGTIDITSWSAQSGYMQATLPTTWDAAKLAMEGFGSYYRAAGSTNAGFRCATIAGSGVALYNSNSSDLILWEATSRVVINWRVEYALP